MRTRILFCFILVSLLTACSSSNKTVTYAENRALSDALKKLNKRPDDPALKRDVIDLYNQAVNQHEQRISAYRSSVDMNRFDGMIAEYNTLQKINESVRTSSVFRDVQTKNYLADIQEVKTEAAESYYQSGLRNLDYGTKRDARRAYDDFQRTKRYVGYYKDVDRMIRVAYEASVVNVLINPIQNSFPGMWNSNNNWNYDPRIRYLHEQLARDLGGQSGSGQTRYFTEMDMRRLNIMPDVVVDINWSFMQSPPNVINRYTRQLSKTIEIGKDTANRPVYQTVRATLHITRYQNQSNDIDYRIVDAVTNQTLDWNRIQTRNNSQIFETATYTGDSRALSDEDWRLVNNRGNSNQQDQMIREMYDDLLRELRNRISSRMLQ
jgi:hypothetical protein